MEHRLSIRTPLRMNVVIYYSGLGLVQAHSLDISRNGMLVHTGPMSLPLHAMVDVAFPLEADERTDPPQRTPAMVVRLANEGVGLMFADEITTDEIFLKSPRDGSQNHPLLARTSLEGKSPPQAAITLGFSTHI